MNSVLVDFALLSALLLLAHLLRSRLRILRTLYLPTSIIAGFLALAFGHQGFDIVPFSQASAGSTHLADYPRVLVVLLFATLLLGARKHRQGNRAAIAQVGDTFFYNLSTDVGQFGFALLFGLLVVLPLFPSLDVGFALLLPAGFVGGHGTVAAIGGVLQENGWEDALTVGYTFATIGLLSGVAGGLLLINVGARAGWTRFVTSKNLSRSGESSSSSQTSPQSLGSETVDPIAIDTLTWHFVLVLVAVGLGEYAARATEAIVPDGIRLPLFVLAMLGGGCLQKFLDILRLGQTVERRVMSRLGSLFSDYLVTFGIASIEIPVVIEYALPLTIMSAFGVALSAAMLWFVGRRIFHDYWFERSLFVFGWNTGVVAIGVALLRVVDPRFESKTLEDFGLAYFFISFFTLAIIVVLPQLVVAGHVTVPALVLCGACVLCLLLSRRLVGWFPLRANAIRQGEAPPPGHGEKDANSGG